MGTTQILTFEFYTIKCISRPIKVIDLYSLFNRMDVSGEYVGFSSLYNKKYWCI